MQQDYELTKGVALVLVGPEGCGKTTLAYEIAQRYGKVRSVSGFGLHHVKGQDALRDSPDVLIVDEITDGTDIDIIKGLVTHDTVSIPHVNGTTYAPVPTYIICTGSPNALHISRDDRRFRVVDVNKPHRGRDEIEAENAELRELLTAAYRELQRHGVQSVPLGPYSLPVDPPEPFGWRCRCTAQPVDGIGTLIGRMSREESALDDGNFIDDRARGVTDATRHWRKELERIVSRCDDPMGVIRAELEAEDNDRGATHEAAPVSQAAWASRDPKEYTPVHNAVLRFLRGTAPYNGLWFHEAESGASPYWWRAYLPKPEGGEDG